MILKILQNGAKFIQKLSPGFKNHLRNLDNFSQAVESSKSWNLTCYFCPKNTFFQLKRYIQTVYLTLVSTTCVKIHHYVIFETISYFLRHNSSVFFLAQTLHTLYNSSPSKRKFSDFSLLLLKFTKSPMSVFKQKVSFLQSLDLFSVSWETIFLYFFSLNFICYWQK